MSADTLDSYLDDFDSNPFEDTAPTAVSVVSQLAPRITAPLSAANRPHKLEPASEEVEQDDQSTEDQEMASEEEEEATVIPVKPAQAPLKFSAAPPSTARASALPVTPKVQPSAPISTKVAEPLERADQSDWFSMCDDTTEASTVSHSPPAQSEVTEEPKSEEGEEATRNFFLLDASAEQETPGTVILFGKILNPKEGNKAQSCCVRVENVPKTLFFLPRVFRAEKILTEDGKEEWVEDQDHPVSVRDVCEEFNRIRGQYNIKKFMA